MRCLAYGVALLLLFVLLTGCGGGGGGRATTPVPTGSIEGHLYADRAKSRLLVSPKVLAVGTPVSLGTKTASAMQTRAGAALDGAQVTVRGYANLTATTDPLGYFRIDNVPSGSQTLLVTLAGYAALTVPVTVVANSLSEAGNVTLASVQHKWTVMVYLDANLTGQDVLPDGDNFAQLEAAPESPLNPSTQSPYVETLVQYAKAGAPNTCNIYEVHHRPTGGQSASVIKQTLGSTVDMGNPTTLHTFITWCQQNEPAEHYLLVLWDHGSGWDPWGDSPPGTRTAGSTAKMKSAALPVTMNPRAICFDDLHNSAIRDVDLTQALTVNAPIDIVATDACLMSMLEVGYQIRHQANYLVGSEDETPSEGYNYTDVVAKLVSEYATITPSAYAGFLAQDAFNYWTQTLGYSSLETSTLDLSHMDTAAASLGQLSSALITNKSRYASQITTVEQQVARFSPDSKLSATGYAPFADLYDYSAQLISNVPNSQVQSAATSLQSAVAAAVLANYHTNDGTYPRAHGMSIYMPGAADYLNPSPYYLGYTPANYYPQLALAQATSWPQWLGTQP